MLVEQIALCQALWSSTGEVRPERESCGSDLWMENAGYMLGRWIAPAQQWLDAVAGDSRMPHAQQDQSRVMWYATVPPSLDRLHRNDLGFVGARAG